MAELGKILKRFLQDVIAIPKKDMQQAVRSREWVLDRVREEISRDRLGPQLYGERPLIYYGSYFRGTKVRSADEFDVMLVLDSNSGQFRSGGSVIGTGLGNSDPNHKYDADFQKEDGSGVSPSKLLNWLKGVATRALGEFGVESPIRDGQALTVHLGGRDINLDLIPGGVFVQSGGVGGVFFDIPRGDAENGWILTNPERDKERIDENAKAFVDIKSVIRILKFVKSSESYNMHIPSFGIESACQEYAEQGNWRQEIGADFVGSISHLRDCLREGVIADPVVGGGNLVDPTAKNAWYANRLGEIKNKLRALRGWTSESDAYAEAVTILSNGRIPG